MSRGPWSIKGIDSRARERAREKAQRSGLTLGEYLNHLLIEEDSSEFGDQQRYGADHVVADRYSDVIAEVDALADRLRSGPQARAGQMHDSRTIRTPGAKSTARRGDDGFGYRSRAAMEDTLQDIIDRLDSSDHGHQTLASRFDATMAELRATQDALRERMQNLSPNETSRKTMEAMRALESALSRLAREVHDTHLELSGEQAQLRDEVERAASQRGESQRRIEDSLARLTSEADRIAAQNELHDKKLASVTEKTETAYETARLLGRELNGRVDAAEEQAQKAAKSAEDARKTADIRTSELTQRLQSLATLTDNKLEEALHLADTALARTEDLDSRIKSANPASSAEVQDIARQAREALAAAQESTRTLGERLAEAESKTDKKLAGVMQRTAKAVEDASKKSEALSERMDETDARIDDQLGDILESTANAIRTARAETRQLSERMDKVLDKTSETIETVTTQNKDLADRLNARVEEVESRFGTNQQNVAAIMGRVSELGSKLDRSESKSATALETLQAAMARINERFDTAEKSSEGAIKSLEDSFSGFNERLDEVERRSDDGGALRESFQQSLNDISDTMSRSLQSVRKDLERQIAETADNPAEISRLESRIEELQVQLADNENRQAEAVEVISSQFERMTGILDERLRDVEDRSNGGDLGLDELRGEIGRISADLDSRLQTVESREATALESVASEVAQMADKLEKRVKDTETRSAAAIEQVGEQVVRVAERIQARQDETTKELSDRIDTVGDEHQARLDDALDGVGRRLDQVAEAAATALGPVQDTVASLARRMEVIEDMDHGAAPPPFTEEATLIDADAADDHSALPVANAFETSENIGMDEKEIAVAAHAARREFADQLASTMQELEAEDAFAEDTFEDDAEADTESSPDLDALFEHGSADDSDPVTDFLEDVKKDLPSAFGKATATDLFDDAPEAEFEAELPPHPLGESATPDALRYDQGDNDDPFARSSVNTLDFLTEARKAALERGGDNRQISDYGAGSHEPAPRKNGKLPMVAAGALAFAVAGGAGMMMMRGKTTGGEDAFTTVPPSPDAASATSAADTSVDEQELFAEGEDLTEADAMAGMEDDLFNADDAAPVELASIKGTESSSASPPAASTPETPPAGPRKVSALEAFASQQPAGASNSAPKQTLEQAARDGDPVAMHDLALQQLADGDKRLAAETMTRAASRGLTLAQYRLAKLYERGEGVPRSVKEARNWTQQAATGGNVKAMHDLAVFYAEGEGGDQSYVAAVEWFTRAANNGLVDSQYNLGVLYEQGLGVTQNLGEAALWFEIAGKNGDADAERRARDILRRLSPQEADTARRRASLFTPLNPDPRPNGVFGQKSWEAPLKAQILETQRLLNMLDYQAGTADGVMGARTRAAISRFEADNNLAITGNVSSELIDILRAQSIGG